MEYNRDRLALINGPVQPLILELDKKFILGIKQTNPL